MPFKDIQGHRC